jgi:hypothetical protein
VAGSHVKLEQTPQVSILHSGYTNHSSLYMSEGFRQNLICTRPGFFASVCTTTCSDCLFIAVFFSVEPQLKFWGDLPDDIKLHIVSLAATVPKFLNYSVASKAMRQLVRTNEERLWPAMYRATFKKEMPAEPPKDTARTKFRRQYAFIFSLRLCKLAV